MENNNANGKFFLERAGKIDLSVIAPCFNEENNIIALVSRLESTFTKHGIKGQIVHCE